MALTDIQTLTPEKKAERYLRGLAFGWYGNSIDRYESALRHFWRDHNATPQQISDELGTDAGDLFAFIAALRTFILTVNPNAQLTPPNSLGTWTVNPDGTVTINSVNQ